MEKRVERRKRAQAKDVWARGSLLLLRSSLFLLAFIIVVQAVMFLWPQAGPHLNTALRLEGKPLQTEELVLVADGVARTPWAVMSLKMLDYASRPEVTVLLDGKETGSFITSEVTINVKHGSVIAIRNPHRELAVTVVISKKTPNIQEPEIASQVTGCGTLFFSPVVIK